MKKQWITPFGLPIYFFAATIFIGAGLLHLPSSSLQPGSVSWMNALFTATSATCVTGLAVLPTSAFSLFGQSVILFLIQLGGLGIMTYTSLVFYLWRKRISIMDRLAVGQSLLHDPTFHLGSFLKQLVLVCFCIELVGALALLAFDPLRFAPFSAFFHSISAFCNAGFSLFDSSLMYWQNDWGVNMVFMLLIVLGGVGFSVLIDILQTLPSRLQRQHSRAKKRRLAWQSSVVLRTSLFLILLGWGAIVLAEFHGNEGRSLWSGAHLLTALFQSVSSRTAGFNTVNICTMTNISLIVLLALMLVGGSPGSCAGGIKTTTFRTIIAFAWSQLVGRRQVVINGQALEENSVNKALILLIMAVVMVVTATLLLSITEGGNLPHPEMRGQFLEILFEVISAFGTVGLSTGLTPGLTGPGKGIIMVLMFVGRLGPIAFLAIIQGWQTRERFSRPERSMLIG
ncbi:MAG: potassium transporter TrkG [Desulfoplanes sp.]|nr:potassium transporter TrkG [Desulfoplanes sp.]